jgi:cysteine-rich repeat protein
MLIDVTRRPTVFLGLILVATTATACSGGEGLSAIGHIDAGLDLRPDVVAMPDVVAPADRPKGDLATADLAVADSPVSTCGNGRIDPGEQCDDGNTASDDGCSRTCQIVDWPPVCPQPPCFLVVCGDGVLGSSEVCDDGNVTSGDGCADDCQAVEEGWRCPVAGKRCIPLCGDRRLTGSENCDDGNVANGDGCSSTCLTEPGWDCSSGVCMPISTGDGGQAWDGGALICGDGIISGAEECDDGDLNDNDIYNGCSTECTFVTCGDGMVNGPEECDLGPRNGAAYGDADGCTLGCARAHYCGDGIIDSSYGEECDLGVLNGAPGEPCLALCKLWIP